MKPAAILVAALATAGVVFAATAADTPEGKALFDANCAKCHGMDGMASTPAGKAMKARVLSDAHFASLEAATLLRAIRENPKHKAVSGKVTDADLPAIAGHIRELAGGSAASK